MDDVLRLNLKKTNINKISVSMTWDDNSIRHSTLIAPIFIQNGLTCTFYIVPGESNFFDTHALNYSELSKQGFEIGSHSYSHHHMTNLLEDEAKKEFILAIETINKSVHKYPTTFAFPHHDYNDSLISQAHKFHLETRNTLKNAKRFSLKSATSIDDLIESFNNAVSGDYNIVFSGHSVLGELEHLNQQEEQGYEPIQISVLTQFISYLGNNRAKADIITFEQAALKEFIKLHAISNDNNYLLNPVSLNYLSNVGITPEIINSIL